MRTPNPKIDPESPAAKIAARFDKKGRPVPTPLAKALNRRGSTVQRWLENGSIPDSDHAAVVEAGVRLKLSPPLRPADFVDARVFAKPTPAPANPDSVAA